jgi:hypothetical protein
MIDEILYVCDIFLSVGMYFRLGFLVVFLWVTIHL